ncbi:MAG: DUF1778 domain-containing protein [Acidobacteria bacterium]|nr:DUF1778 domain-containing protein [Acidobacteriota bacterium]
MSPRSLEDHMPAEPRDSTWNFRVKAQSDALVREAATLSGTTRAPFVEESAVTRARSLIAAYRPVIRFFGNERGRVMMET